MANRKSEIYIVEDRDLSIYKIGRRAYGNPRMGSESSYLKNGYVTDLVLRICSKPLEHTDAIKLEAQLHNVAHTYRVEYPIVTMSIVAHGTRYEKKRNANGYTEWFALPEDMLARIESIIKEA